MTSSPVEGSPDTVQIGNITYKPQITGLGGVRYQVFRIASQGRSSTPSVFQLGGVYTLNKIAYEMLKQAGNQPAQLEDIKSKIVELEALGRTEQDKHGTSAKVRAFLSFVGRFFCAGGLYYDRAKALQSAVSPDQKKVRSPASLKPTTYEEKFTQCIQQNWLRLFKQLKEKGHDVLNPYKVEILRSRQDPLSYVIYAQDYPATVSSVNEIGIQPVRAAGDTSNLTGMLNISIGNDSSIQLSYYYNNKSATSITLANALQNTNICRCLQIFEQLANYSPERLESVLKKDSQAP